MHPSNLVAGILVAEHRQYDILLAMEPSTIIQAVRRRQGLTQAELARRAGTSQPVVSAYEHGRRDPSYATLRKLVEAGGERLQLAAVAATSDLPPPADVAEHARRLLDVLTLADAIPVRTRPAVLDAPRLVST
jgi:transcriptional regulator with XRE-family HTH domain